jgi:hypothetical protein
MIKRNNIYGDKGLVEDIFTFAITSAFVAPFLKLFDFSYIMSRLMYKFKTTPCNLFNLSRS